jgi:ribosomal protein S18 acetylase RimI-like enzyme
MSNSHELRVSRPQTATLELEQAIARLLPQLSSARVPTRPELERMLASGATRLFLAHIGERVVGMLALVIFRIPSGVRAWVEDVVVDTESRGRGVGEALTKAALDLARKEGVRTVDLTSRPSREVANRLYQRLGFKLRETNFYRYEFNPEPGDP